MQLLLIAVGVVVLLPPVAQLVLPRLAARVVRDRLGGPAEAVDVSVEALPALKLLRGRADRVAVRLRRFDLRELDLADELEQSAAVGELEVRVDHVTGPRELVLRDAHLRKRGDALEGDAALDPADLATVLPEGVEAHPVATADGSAVLEGRATVFGFGTALRLNVVVDAGRIVVRPENGLLAALANYTVFADERVAIETVTAAPLPDGRFRYRVTGRVRKVGEAIVG